MIAAAGRNRCRTRWRPHIRSTPVNRSTAEFAGTVSASAVVAAGSFTAGVAQFSGDVQVHGSSGTSALSLLTHDVLSMRNAAGATVTEIGTDGTDTIIQASGDIYLNATGSIKSSGDLVLEPDGLVEFKDAGATAGGFILGFIHVKVNGVQRRVPFYGVSQGER